MEIKKENLTLKQLPAVIGIIFVTVLIVGFSSFLETVDGIIISANAEGIHYFVLSSFKMAFITTPAQLVIISLFREINDPIKKYGRAFGGLFAGFIGVYVMLNLLNNPLMQNLSGYFQVILGLFPILTLIIVRLAIRQEFNE